MPRANILKIGSKDMLDVKEHRSSSIAEDKKTLYFDRGNFPDNATGLVDKLNDSSPSLS